MPDAPDNSIFVLRPTLIFTAVWYVIAGVIVIGAAALAGLMTRWVGLTWEEAAIGLLVVGIGAFSIPVYKHIVRRREVYTLTNNKLEMRYGILARTVRNIPLRNIQDVTVTASAWQRLLGLGDIWIDSAAESGKIRLLEVRHPERYANQILGQIRQR